MHRPASTKWWIVMNAEPDRSAREEAERLVAAALGAASAAIQGLDAKRQLRHLADRLLGDDPWAAAARAQAPAAGADTPAAGAEAPAASDQAPAGDQAPVRDQAPASDQAPAGDQAPDERPEPGP